MREDAAARLGEPGAVVGFPLVNVLGELPQNVNFAIRGEFVRHFPL